jgi:hypothetical protein
MQGGTLADISWSNEAASRFSLLFAVSSAHCNHFVYLLPSLTRKARYISCPLSITSYYVLSLSMWSAKQQQEVWPNSLHSHLGFDPRAFFSLTFPPSPTFFQLPTLPCHSHQRKLKRRCRGSAQTRRVASPHQHPARPSAAETASNMSPRPHPSSRSRVPRSSPDHRKPTIPLSRNLLTLLQSHVQARARPRRRRDGGILRPRAPPPVFLLSIFSS